MRTVPWAEPGARSGSTTGVCPNGRRKRGRRGDLERAAELSREPGRHLGPGAAIEAKFWQGEGESPSSALAEAGEVEERNDRWASRWESMNQELRRAQEEFGQLMGDLRSVEWSRFASKPQPEGQTDRTKTGRELPKPERDRNMCR